MQPLGAKIDRLAAMETFVKVVETGSFSKAAALLGIGQPAVSKTIAQLEERLGVKLLSRTTRGIAVTDSGKTFHTRALRAIDEADQAELAARGVGAGLTGRLRVSAAVTFASQHVIPHLQPFLDAHPALEIDIVLDDQPVSLIEEGVDVALRLGELADSTFLARRLASSPRLVLASPDYLASRGEPTTPSHLAEHEAVIYARGPKPNAWTFSKGSLRQSVVINGRLRVSAAEGLRAAVRSGLGFAVASRWMFAAELASGQVQVILKDWRTDSIDLWALFPSGRLPSVKASAFADYVQSQLAGYSLEE